MDVASLFFLLAFEAWGLRATWYPDLSVRRMRSLRVRRTKARVSGPFSSLFCGPSSRPNLRVLGKNSHGQPLRPESDRTWSAHAVRGCCPATRDAYPGRPRPASDDPSCAARVRMQ